MNTDHHMHRMDTPTPYAGTVDDAQVDDAIARIGRLIQDAGEVGFVLTYHAVDAPHMSGRFNLEGTGISQDQLGILLARALEHNAEHGSTT